MARRSLLSTANLYLYAATLAAHATQGEAGFRQRDLRFYVDLFSNWLETTLGARTLELHNAQVARFLESLVREALCRKVRVRKTVRYRLSRAGIVEVLARMVQTDRILPLEQFFFAYYAIRNYGERISALARGEGSQFPRALQIELDTLRDPKQLVARQVQFVDKELAKLEARIQDGLATAALTQKLLGAANGFPDVVAAIQQRYPYELSNQKPLDELLAQMPRDLARWELEHGARLRATQIWKPFKEMLEAYRRALLLLEAPR